MITTTTIASNVLFLYMCVYI